MNARYLLLSAALLSFLMFAVWAFTPALNSFFDPQEFTTFLNALKGETPFLQYLHDGWSWENDQGSLIGFFRPLASTIYMIEYHVFGSTPIGYKVTSFIVHLFCSLILGYTVAVMCGRKWIALAAGLMFAVHPGTVRAVGWISARPDMLAAVFSLLAFRYTFQLRESGSFTRSSLLPAPFTALALSSKELGISNLLALPVTYFLWPGRTRNRKNTVFFITSLILVLVGYLLVRLWLFSNLGGYSTYAPLSEATRRILTVISQVTGASFIPVLVIQLLIYLAVALLMVVFAIKAEYGFRRLTVALLVISIYSFQSVMVFPDGHYVYASAAFTTLFLASFFGSLKFSKGIQGGIVKTVFLLLLISFGFVAHRESLIVRDLNPMSERIFRGLEDIVNQLPDNDEAVCFIHVSDSSPEHAEMKNVPLYMQFIAPDRFRFSYTRDSSVNVNSPVIIWNGSEVTVIR